MTIWHRLHGFYRNTSEPSRMENRRRGGGNQCRKHRSTPRIRYPSTTAGAIRPARKRPATDQHAADGPAHDSAGGAGAPDAKELLVVAILHSCAVSREGAISSRFMRLADRCFGPCGTAARRLPGTPVGDTPICVSFRAGTEKVGSGLRDLVLHPLSPRWISSIWKSHHHQPGSALSIGGDW